MRGYLLDTHTFLWWTGEPARLPTAVLGILRSPDSSLLLSTASAWELQIKVGLGKLQLDVALEEIIDREIAENGLALLPIELAHIIALGALPPLHRDPFDRMLIAQARAEDLVLVSGDGLVRAYPDVAVLWA